MPRRHPTASRAPATSPPPLPGCAWRPALPLRLCGAAFFLGVAASCAPAVALAQLSDLAAIRSAATEIASRNRALAERSGADYQKQALDVVRRSCARNEVTRLDEVAPSSVVTQSKDTDAKHLLDLRFPATSAAPQPAKTVSATMEVVDENTEFEVTPQGLVLRRGQIRTTAAFSIPREAIGTIELDIVTSAPAHLLLGWSKSATAPRLRRNNARVELLGDGHVHTYAVDAGDALARGIEHGESVRRFFLASRADAPLEIRAIRVLSRGQRFAAGSFGATHETRDGQTRSVLFTKPPTMLTWSVVVPQTSPVFETGLAVVTTDGVLEFEVAIRDGEEHHVLIKRLVRDAPWENVSLDLSPWQGNRVEITLAVRGTRDAIGLWSSPLLRPRLGPEATKPILVFLEDALRADRLSVYGSALATPAHERIAAGGVVFERAFAQATQTRSSVPSMMTSLLPSTNGTWDFSDALSDKFVTLAEALRACGFATASFLQNGNAGAYAGLAQGFDVVFSEETFGERTADLLSPSSPLDAWIGAQSGRPWFAYVHILDPHGPYDPAVRPDLSANAADEELARDRALDAEWMQRPTTAARRLLYDREVEANDAVLGDFLKRLEDRGDFERAVVAVVADHGEFLGEHGGLWRHHPPGHVEVAHVPFLLRAPGATPQRVSQPVGLLDLMPTLLDLAGADSSSLVLHGSSLSATLHGKTPPNRAIPAEEMLLDRGERRAAGCGSFATTTTLWLLSCTRDSDYTPGRPLPQRSEKPAALRRFELSPAQWGHEIPAGALASPFFESIARGCLVTMQRSGLSAWKATTQTERSTIASEAANTGHLRSLGYLE